MKPENSCSSPIRSHTAIANDIPDKITAARDGSSSGTLPRFDVPELLAGWSELGDPEDRADCLEALQTLAKLVEEELCFGKM